jgi:3-hydroxyisobutyrate dehydrogenase
MKVGFIGLGAMGLGIATNLRSAGHGLAVYDRNEEPVALLAERGAHPASTPADAAEDADIVFTCLPGPAEIEEVAFSERGLLAAMKDGAAWFDFTTNSTAMIHRMHEAFYARGVEVLDAPISGGPQGARTGRLALWVGGDKTTFDRHLSVLKTVADRPLHMGPIGSGCITKIVHNTASFVAQSALAEAFTLGVKSGLDPLRLFEALRDGTTGRSRTFDRLAEQFLPGVYEPPAFTLKLAHKDMALALDIAQSCDYPMRQTEIARADMATGLQRGWGGRDARVSLTLHEERAGISIRVPKDRLNGVLTADG